MPFLRYMINSTVIDEHHRGAALLLPGGIRVRPPPVPREQVLFSILIVTMLIPWQALMVPQFLFYVKLGWWHLPT